MKTALKMIGKIGKLASVKLNVEDTQELADKIIKAAERADRDGNGWVEGTELITFLLDLADKD